MYSSSIIFCLESTFYLLWIIIQYRGWCARKHTLCILCSVEQCQKYKKNIGEEKFTECRMTHPVLQWWLGPERPNLESNNLFFSSNIIFVEICYPFQQVGVALPVHGDLRFPKRSKPAPSPVHWHMIVWSHNLKTWRNLKQFQNQEKYNFTSTLDFRCLSLKKLTTLSVLLMKPTSPFSFTLI